MSYIINKYVDKVNTKGEIITIRVHPHTFRHSKAVHLLESGVELIYIRDILGHSNESTTQIYAKVSAQSKRKALEKVYKNVTDDKGPDWNEDKDLMNWLNQISKSKE